MPKAIGETGKPAMFAVAFLALVREGLELALFLLATEASSSILQTLSGAVAGLVANSMGEFNEAGILPTIIAHVWNASPILSNDSTLGEMLKALVGYNAAPSLTQFLAYLAYFAFLWFSFRIRQRTTLDAVKQHS